MCAAERLGPPPGAAPSGRDRAGVHSTHHVPRPVLGLEGVNLCLANIQPWGAKDKVHPGPESPTTCPQLETQAPTQSSNRHRPNCQGSWLGHPHLGPRCGQAPPHEGRSPCLRGWPPPQQTLGSMSLAGVRTRRSFPALSKVGHGLGTRSPWARTGGQYCGLKAVSSCWRRGRGGL